MRLALPAFAGLSAPVKGALLMTGAAVAFSGMIGLLRLATDALHPFEVAFFRNLFGLVFMLPWLMRTRFQGLHTERLGLHGLRALTGLAAMLMWFMALSLMPLGEAVALSFTTPLFVTIGAALAAGQRWIRGAPRQSKGRDPAGRKFGRHADPIVPAGGRGGSSRRGDAE